MTWEGVGMAWEGVGMAWEGLGMTGATRGNDVVGGCGSDVSRGTVDPVYVIPA